MGEKDIASIFHIVCIFVGSSSIVGFFCLCLIWSVGWNTEYVGLLILKIGYSLGGIKLSGHRDRGWHPEFGGRSGAWEEYIEGGLTWQDPGASCAESGWEDRLEFVL